MENLPFNDDLLPEPNSRTWWIYSRDLLIGALPVLILAVVIALASYGWRFHESYAKDRRDRQFYSDLNSIVEQIQREREATSPDFASIRDRARHITASIANTLKSDAGPDFPARQALLWAARDEFPRLLREDMGSISVYETAAIQHLAKAAYVLKLPPPVLPPEQPQVVTALAEIERLGGTVTRDPSQTVGPVTAIAMKGAQFRDQHLDHLPNITSLQIESPEVTDKGMRKLSRIRTLQACSLRCEKISDGGIENLAALPALNEVHLYDCTGITDVGLLSLKQVQRLVLFGPHITDRTLGVLKDLPNLEHLTLRSNSLTDDGVGSLTDVPRLAVLALSHCHNLTDVALARIAEIRNLEQFGIQGSDITDAGLDSVGNLPRLQQLVIAPCEDRMPDGLRMTDAGLTRMKNLNRLQTFSVQGCPGITDASVNAMQKMGSLKHLQLKETGITEEGHQQIVSSLPETRVDFVLTPPSPLDGIVATDRSSKLPSFNRVRRVKAGRCRILKRSLARH